MDCWCALCAVGPTFLFPVIQSLHNAAVTRGLPPELALEAVSQVIAGTAHLALRGHRTVSQLERMIGLHTLQEEEAGRLFAAAYEQAVERLKGLGQKLAA
jgi:pyrroline-5-carboxylate reductase